MAFAEIQLPRNRRLGTYQPGVRRPARSRGGVTFYLKRTALTIAAVMVVVFGFQYTFPTPPRFSFDRVLSLSASDRILVVAPHCDDESLATGGLIAKACSRGIPVTTVIVTNGDGFTLAAEDRFHSLRVTPQKLIELGRVRQEESLRALRTLGVPEDHVIFLCYPDRGLSHLWEDHWDKEHPYTSRYTRVSSSPYERCFRPGTRYAGESLAGDLMTIIANVRPSLIFLPHPNDAHPDHSTAYCFVTYALQCLEEHGVLDPNGVKVFTYVVHRGNWPAPKGLNIKRGLVPPAGLLRTDTNWVELPLDPILARKKLLAILEYKSQTAIMRRYMVSFARSNEFYGEIPVIKAERVADGSIVIDGSARDWPGGIGSFNNTVGDALIRRVEAPADIARFYVARDEACLLVRVDTRGNSTSRVTYRVHLHPVGGCPPGVRLRYDLELKPPGYVRVVARDDGRGGTPAGDGQLGTSPRAMVRFWASGRTLELGVPVEILGTSRTILINIESRVGDIRVDQTGWQLLRLCP
ncbi:MAG TPA: PIG-L family deacetylase [Firmicutes bacterium]|nr:PIG-L family deacetylase [Bacillota bacterium]